MKDIRSSPRSDNSRTLYDVGIPMLALAWPLFWLSFVPVVPLMAAWLGPVEDERIIFAAFVVLAIPFCAASIYLEYHVARRQLPDIDRLAVYKWARSANIYSYAAIIVAAAVYTAIQWKRTA